MLLNDVMFRLRRVAQSDWYIPRPWLAKLATTMHDKFTVLSAAVVACVHAWAYVAGIAFGGDLSQGALSILIVQMAPQLVSIAPAAVV